MTTETRLLPARPPRPRTIPAAYALELAAVIVLGVVALLLILPPVYAVVRTAFHLWAGGREQPALTVANLKEVLAFSGMGWALLRTSAVFAFASSLVSLVIGGGLSWLVERTDVPGRNLAYFAAYLSLAAPGLVKVIGWILLLGPRAGFVNVFLRDLFHLQNALLNVYSLAGMIWVQGIIRAPIVFLLLSGPFRSIDSRLEEAAAISGAGPVSTLRRVVIPLAWPSILASLILSVVGSLESFEAPALIGLPGNTHVLATRIYLEVRSGFSPNFGLAAAYALLLMAMVGVLLIPYSMLTRQTQRFMTVGGKGFGTGVVRLGRLRPVAFLPVLLMCVLVVAPLLALGWVSLLPFPEPFSLAALGHLTADAYASVLASHTIARALRNSLIASSLSATIVMVFCLATAWVLVRGRLAARWLLDQLISIPVVIPGIVAGLAVLRTYVGLPLPIYGTPLLLIIAFVMRFLPYGIRYAHPALLQIHPELEEAAQTLGINWATTLRRVTFPLMTTALFAGWTYVFMISIRELDLAILLTSPGNDVLATRIWTLWTEGTFPQVGALGVMLVTFLGSLQLMLLFLSRRFGLEATR